MKHLQKYNNYLKISLFCAIAAFLTQCALFVFVLLPTYNLIDSEDPNPDVKLQALADRSTVLSFVVYGLLVAVVVFGIIGYIKMKKARKHDSK